MTTKQDGNIGENIKQLRQQAGLTQEQLAAQLQVLDCNISRGTLAKIESGIRHLYVEELKAIAKVFNVSYEDIIEK